METFFQAFVERTFEGCRRSGDGEEGTNRRRSRQIKTGGRKEESFLSRGAARARN